MDLYRLLGLLRRGWLILVLFTVAGAGLGAAQAELTTPRYAAHVTLLFSLNGKGSLSVLAEGNTYIQDLMPSYVKVITTPLVLQPVVDQLGLEVSAPRLAHSVTVDHQLDSVIAEVSVVDTQPVRAADIANAIADQTRLAAVALSPKGSTDLGQVTVTQVSRAIAPSSPFSPVLLTDVIRGLLVGFVLGVLGIILWDVIFSSAVSSRAAVARATRAPVLGLITLDPKSKLRPLPVYTQPLLPRSESFRFLQSYLSTLAGPRLSVVVTSAFHDEGRTSTAANLAIAMSLSGSSHRVLLIDADLHGAALAGLLNLDPQYGLTSVLTGKAKLEEAVVQWGDGQPGSPSISFLAAGQSVFEPSDLLASEGMSLLIQRAQAQYDVVILDSAPLLKVTDAAILATQTDGAIVVVDAQKTRHRHFAESLSRMRMAGARVIGVVLNRMSDVNREHRGYKPPQHVGGGGRAEGGFDAVVAPAGPDPAARTPAPFTVPQMSGGAAEAPITPGGLRAPATPAAVEHPNGAPEPERVDAPRAASSDPTPTASSRYAIPAILPVRVGQNGDRARTAPSDPNQTVEMRPSADSEALHTRPLQVLGDQGRPAKAGPATKAAPPSKPVKPVKPVKGAQPSTADTEETAGGTDARAKGPGRAPD